MNLNKSELEIFLGKFCKIVYFENNLSTNTIRALRGWVRNITDNFVFVERPCYQRTAAIRSDLIQNVCEVEFKEEGDYEKENGIRNGESNNQKQRNI